MLQELIDATSYIASKKAKDAVYTLLLSAIGAEMHRTLSCIHGVVSQEPVSQAILITRTGNHTTLDTKQSCSSRETEGGNQVVGRLVCNNDPAARQSNTASFRPHFLHSFIGLRQERAIANPSKRVSCSSDYFTTLSHALAIISHRAYATPKLPPSYNLLYIGQMCARQVHCPA